MLILDPSNVYLEKNHPKVSVLTPSSTILVEDNKDKTQRNNKIVFWPPGSEMVFARDARSKQHIWIEMLILDPSRVYLIDPQGQGYTLKKHPKIFIHVCLWNFKSGVLNSPTTNMIKNDQWNHAGAFSISICAGFSLKMHEDAT